MLDNFLTREAPSSFHYTKDEGMAYEDFCDKYMEEAIYEYIDESNSVSGDGSFSTDKCDELVKSMAEDKEVWICDFENFNYDKYFHNWYQSTEKVR